MDAWTLFRFAKFVGVALFSAGVLGGTLLPDQRDRQKAAYVVATVGFVVVCLAGYGLLKVRGLSFREPWVSSALLAALVALLCAAWVATATAVPRFASALGVGALLAAFGFMSFRDGSMLVTVVASLGGAAAAFVLAPRQQAAADPAATRVTFAWFAWIARAEGASLLVLLGVYMPLKYAASIVLDGGQGWFGWLHGVLQLLFVVALVATARALEWSVARTVLGVVASVVPFGTFVFEARVRPEVL